MIDSYSVSDYDNRAAHYLLKADLGFFEMTQAELVEYFDEMAKKGKKKVKAVMEVE